MNTFLQNNDISKVRIDNFTIKEDDEEKLGLWEISLCQSLFEIVEPKEIIPNSPEKECVGKKRKRKDFEETEALEKEYEQLRVIPGKKKSKEQVDRMLTVRKRLYMRKRRKVGKEQKQKNYEMCKELRAENEYLKKELEKYKETISKLEISNSEISKLKKD